MFPTEEVHVRRFTLPIVVAALLLSAAPASAQPPKDPSRVTCDGLSVTHHVHRARALLRDAYDLDRYPGKPDRSAINKAQAHKRCLNVPPAKFAIHEYRAKLVARFEEYAELRRITPYDCGSHGFFAIPCYVVDCESGFDWGAVNSSSGAFSAYQFLPSTYAGVCERCDRSRADLHLAASRVWARSGGSEWACA